MKLPQIPIKTVLRPGRVLFILFIALLAYEAYLLYYRVYINLSIGVEEVSVEDIVRLDLNNYNTVLEEIDKRNNYIPPTRDINNPF
jgi:hypothetical protein